MEIFPSTPAADEYRIEFSDAQDLFYQEGKRIPHSEYPSFTVTQGGLQPGTKYTFRVLPYTDGIPGKASPTLNVTTSK